MTKHIRNRRIALLVSLLFLAGIASGALPVPAAQAHGGKGSSDGFTEDRRDPAGDEDHSGKDDGDATEDDDRSGSGSGDDDSGSSGQQRDDGGAQVERAGNLREDGKGREGAATRIEALIELAQDDRGARMIEGEILHLSARRDIVQRLSARGVRIIEAFRLPTAGLQGVRISVPDERTAAFVASMLKQVDPRGISGRNHVYSAAAGQQRDAGLVTGAGISVPGPVRLEARIGLVDAGVDAKHPLLRNVKIVAQNFGLATAAPAAHGTAVASRIASAAPGSTILVACVFSSVSDGEEIATVDAIARGLDWLAQQNVPVINLSLTGPANPVLEAMTRKLIARGHVLVAAVGNEGPHAAPQYPAAYDDVVGVTAVDSSGNVYRYANQGQYVDFAATGVDAPVAKSPDEVEMASGTSYAAPLVSVALARLVRKPAAGAAQRAATSLRAGARDIGEPGRDPVFGYGLVDTGR